MTRISQLAKTIIKHPFFTGSLVMILGSNLFNAGQFLYHFLTARSLQHLYGDFLGKAYYGDVAVIISLLGVVAIVQLSLGLTMVKFITSEKTEAVVSNLAKWFVWWTFWLALFVGVLLTFISPFLAEFLNIAQPNVFYLVGPILGLYLLVSTGRSILQGLLQFYKYVISLLSEVLLKIILVVALILAGLAAFGAILAIFLGVFLSFLVTLWALRRYLRGKRGERPAIAPLLKYSFPVLLQGLALTSMYSTDLLLVKHFFPPEEAGLYAGLAILGRIVFFGASPVTHVMFPLIARRYSHGQPYHVIFYLSVLLVTGIAFLVTLTYYLLPSWPILILYGSGFLDGAPLLWWFGVFMGLLALGMLFTQFYLSIGKTKVVILFAASALLQIILIWFIHPDILTVIKLSILSVFLLVLALLVYFPYHHKW